ncbi:hypothetical protein BD769DRAFT_1303809, partial [Suillus cothurnatus]
CEDTESMEHIIVHCNKPTKKIIWALAEDTWPEKHGPWLEPNISLILEINNKDNQKANITKRGATHLLKILISESADLIWTLRCERVICNTTHTEEIVKKCWLNVID